MITSTVYWMAVLFSALPCHGQGTFWETTQDIYESFQAIPPLEETRKNLMKYFLDRPDDSRGKRYTPYYDIVFVLDSCNSTSKADFNLSLTVAQSLVTRFDPDTLFAVVTFGSNASVSFNFTSAKHAIEYIAEIQEKGGKRNILDALKKAQNMLLLNRDSGVRAGSRKRLLLVTNGPSERKPNDSAKLQKIMWEAIQIRQMGPEVFLVAVGHRISRIDELVVIPSSTDAHFYRVSSMTALKQIVDGIPVHIFYQDDYFDE